MSLPTHQKAALNSVLGEQVAKVKASTLLVHNHYRSSVPSGENQVVENEIALLEKHGHLVNTYFRYSDDIHKKGMLGTVSGALSTPWNPFSAKRSKK